MPGLGLGMRIGRRRLRGAGGGAPAELVIDAFQRADASTPGTADNGQTYSGLTERWRVSNNALIPPAATGDSREVVESEATGNFRFDVEMTSADAANRTSVGVLLACNDVNNGKLALIANDAGNAGGATKLFGVNAGSYDGAPNSSGGATINRAFGASEDLRYSFYKLETGMVAYEAGDFLWKFRYSDADQATFLNATKVGVRADRNTGTDNGTTRITRLAATLINNWTGHTGAPVKVIVCTDMSSDPEDLLAISVLCQLARLAVPPVQILGVCVNTSNTKSPGVVAAILNWYGITGASLGCWKGAAFDPGEPASKTWVDAVYDNYPRAPNGVTIGLSSGVTDAATIYHDLLTANSDVEIVSIGFLNNVSKLLTDEPALVAAKVARLWVMGGHYEYGVTGAEYNLQQAAAAANNVAANWPSPIYWSGFEGGATFKAGSGIAAAFGPGNLLYDALDEADFLPAGREGWDSLTMLMVAMRGMEFHEIRGTNVVNASTGENVFTPSAAGPHRIMFKARRDTRYRDELIDPLLEGDHTANPSFATFP